MKLTKTGNQNEENITNYTEKYIACYGKKILLKTVNILHYLTLLKSTESSQRIVFEKKYLIIIIFTTSTYVGYDILLEL